MNISKYKKQGFVGADINLKTSLYEYGLIWKEFKYNLKKRGIKKGEILAISYSKYPEENTNYAYFTKSELINEDWIDYKDVAEFCGLPVDELKSQDAGHLLFLLISFYGAENFGL